MIDKMNMLSGLPRANGNELTIKEKLEVKSMEQQERSVRQHEQAHLRSARDLTVGGASFDYKRGPDGKKYAVGGEVNINASSVSGDAQATIDKALKVRNAALAPSDPSPQDLQAANRARILEAKAHRKLSRDNQKNPDDTPAVGAYQSNIDPQENLHRILDLFA